LGFPWQLNSIIVRNRKRITAEDAHFDNPAKLHFEPFDGRQRGILQTVVHDCMAARTATNYANGDLERVVSPEQEWHASAQYALTFNSATDPARRCWLIHRAGDYIGFVLGEIKQDAFEGIIYGILPQHRQRNHAEAIMRFLKSWCWQKGISRFENDVVMQNLPSLKSIIRESIAPVESYLHVTINSWLSVSQRQPMVVPEVRAAPVAVLDAIAQAVRGIAAPAFVMEKCQWAPVSDPPDKTGRGRLQIQFPYITADRMLTVGKMMRGPEVMGVLYVWWRAA